MTSAPAAPARCSPDGYDIPGQPARAERPLLPLLQGPHPARGLEGLGDVPSSGVSSGPYRVNALRAEGQLPHPRPSRHLAPDFDLFFSPRLLQVLRQVRHVC
jgi:hypothetical protein